MRGKRYGVGCCLEGIMQGTCTCASIQRYLAESTGCQGARARASMGATLARGDWPTGQTRGTGCALLRRKVQDTPKTHGFELVASGFKGLPKREREREREREERRARGRQKRQRD